MSLRKNGGPIVMMLSVDGDVQLSGCRTLGRSIAVAPHKGHEITRLTNDTTLQFPRLYRDNVNRLGLRLQSHITPVCIRPL